MIIVKVKHYLNSEGIKYFPIWFEYLKNYLTKRKGFVDIGYSIAAEASLCNIVLFFDCNENLNDWAKSDEHIKIISKLDEYRNQPWTAKRYHASNYYELNSSENEIELLGYELCPFTQRINIILTEKNIPHKTTYIDIFNKPEWFNTISPLKEIPVLKFNNKVIFKSNAICEFINDILALELYPKDIFKLANSRAWIEFGHSLIMDIYNMSISQNEKEYSEKYDTVYKKLERINNEKTEKPYFYGDFFSMMDTCYATILIRLNILDKIYKTNMLNKFENLQIWHKELSKKTSVSSSIVDGYSEKLHNLLMKKNAYIITK